MQLARIPSRPWYTAVVLVSMCSAPLAIPYGTLTAMPAVRPSMEDTLMIDPPPAATMAGMACLLE